VLKASKFVALLQQLVGERDKNGSENDAKICKFKRFLCKIRQKHAILYGKYGKIYNLMRFLWHF